MGRLFRRRDARRPWQLCCHAESLEPRRLMSYSAATLLDNGFVPIQSNHQQNWAKAGQWLVEFDSAAPRNIKSLNSSLRVTGSSTPARFTQHLGDDRTFLLNTSRHATLTDVEAALAGVPGIRAIEPDYAIFNAAVTANDPRMNTQWSLEQTNDADIDAPEAWEVSTGSSNVVIAVLDSGIDYNHVDLSMNIWRNYQEIAGNGIDDDANGYIDDSRGWDWVNADNNPADDNGHGTIVAGEIGAVGNNSIGIAGVAWQVKLMPLKFIASSGLGTSGGAIQGMNYVIKQKQAGVNVRAVNASWVNNGYSQIFSDTIALLNTNGILFVAASGNGGLDSVGDDNDLISTYPASYTSSNVIAVAATDEADKLAAFSNYGPTSVALAAPGVSIVTTSPGNNYTYSTGTSDSAPLVSGVIALAAAAAPNATAAQIKAALIAGCDPLPTLIGKVVSNGRLNARRTLGLLLPHASGDGLSASYFDNTDFTGASVSRVDPNVGFDWSSNAPLAGIARNTYSVRWTGSLMPASTELVTLYTRADDGVRLWVNGQLVINRWSERPLPGDITEDGIVNTDDFNVIAANFGRIKASPAIGDLNGDTRVDSLDLDILFGNWGKSATPQEDSVTLTLAGGVKHAIQMDYYQQAGRASARLSWSSVTVPKQIIPQNRLFSAMPAAFTPVTGLALLQEETLD